MKNEQNETSWVPARNFASNHPNEMVGVSVVTLLYEFSVAFSLKSIKPEVPEILDSKGSQPEMS